MKKTYLKLVGNEVGGWKGGMHREKGKRVQRIRQRETDGQAPERKKNK